MTIPACPTTLDANQQQTLPENWHASNTPKTDAELESQVFNNYKGAYPFMTAQSPEELFCRKEGKFYTDFSKLVDPAVKYNRSFSDAANPLAKPTTWAEKIKQAGLDGAIKEAMAEVKKDFNGSVSDVDGSHLPGAQAKLWSACRDLRFTKDSLKRVEGGGWGKVALDFLVPSAIFGLVVERFGHAAFDFLNIDKIVDDKELQNNLYAQKAADLNVCKAGDNKTRITQPEPVTRLDAVSKPLMFAGAALGVIGVAYGVMNYLSKSKYEADQEALCNLPMPDLSVDTTNMSTEDLKKTYLSWEDSLLDIKQAQLKVSEKSNEIQAEIVKKDKNYNPTRINEDYGHEITTLQFTMGTGFFGALFTVANYLRKPNKPTNEEIYNKINKQAEDQLRSDIKAGKVVACDGATAAEAKAIIDFVKEPTKREMSEEPVVDAGQTAAVSNLNSIFGGTADSVRSTTQVARAAGNVSAPGVPSGNGKAGVVLPAGAVRVPSVVVEPVPVVVVP